MITMSRKNDNGISLATPPAIHVGPIITPGSNETISIVIPLSAQLATISGQKVLNNSCKDCTKDTKPQHLQIQQQQQQQSANKNTPRPRRDKTKGCPFPTCTRYGRAFSRAHDLKRHIIRHEMRKEKLSDLNRQQTREGEEYVDANQTLLQRDGQCLIKLDDLREADVKLYSCPRCKKKFASDSKLRVHLSTHEKSQDEMQQMHMRQHTADVQQDQIGKSEQKDLVDKDDDFLLEEMLLLNKNPRRTASPDKTNTGGSKIRCDYCSKTFKTKWTLSSHVAAHEGRFQFDCAQCGKKFVRKSHYEGHVRSHEAARPYVCEQCGKTFKELKHRREHTKRKHSGN